MNRYVITDFLGKGAYGSVHKAYNATGVIALKVIPFETDTGTGTGTETGTETDKRRKLAEKEVEILKRISNPCVPSLACYYNSFIEKNEMFIEMQYIDGPNLTEFARKHKLQKGFTDKLVAILKDIIPGLMYLHSHGIIHRDIKPDNIIIERTKLQPTLIDVGIGCLTKLREECPKECCLGRVGSVPFMAPEVIVQQQAYYESDVWSLGATIYRVLTDKNVYPAKKILLYMEAVRRDPVVLSLSSNNKLNMALQSMLVKDYTQRVKLDNLLLQLEAE